MLVFFEGALIGMLAPALGSWADEMESLPNARKLALKDYSHLPDVLHFSSSKKRR